MCTICICTKTEFGVNVIVVSYGGKHWRAKYHPGSKQLGMKMFAVSCHWEITHFPATSFISPSGVLRLDFTCWNCAMKMAVTSLLSLDKNMWA